MNHKNIVVSLGVFAYNEEKNIDALLDSIENQELSRVRIKEIIVVSSGSNDQTNEIVQRRLGRNKKIRLIIESRRQGKSAAINEFLKIAKSPIVITISADLKLHPRALEEIGICFLNSDVGMAGAHPEPLNVKKSKIGKEVAILWELHHRISLMQPKCGEMVAFRNIVRQIPHDAAVDEATLEILLKLVGYEVVYAPRSIVYNKGPLNVSEFVKQRRRVYVGHQWIDQKYNYQVVTMNSSYLSKVVVDYISSNPKDIVTLVKLLFLEIMSRFLGWFDYHILDRNPYVWNMISR